MRKSMGNDTYRLVQELRAELRGEKPQPDSYALVQSLRVELTQQEAAQQQATLS